MPKPVTVTARRGLNGIARCLRPGCGAMLNGKGKVLSKGRIFALAQARKAASAMTRSELALAA